MIITFDLKNLIRSSGDIAIFDNCKNVRITQITKDNHTKVNDDFNNVFRKRYRWELEIDNAVELKPHLIEFDSSGDSYYIMTDGTVYIANDDNKTFKVIN